MDAIAPTTRRNAASSQDVPLELIDVPEDSLRRIAPTAQQDEGMLASVRTLGVLQPIILRTGEAGRFSLIAGRRRLRAAAASGLPTIPAEVRADLSDADAAAIEAAENMQRLAMSPLDEWRAVTQLRDLGRRDIADIADALGMTQRMVRKLEKLGRMHPSVLEKVGRDGLPEDEALATIAAAPLDLQAEAVKRYDDGDWWAVAHACELQRIPRSRAIFDVDLAGVVFEEDLFAEPDSDEQFTTSDVAGFLEAQRAALLARVEKSRGKEEVAEINAKTGEMVLPRGWDRVWSRGASDKLQKGEKRFLAVNPRSYGIGMVQEAIAKPSSPAATASAAPKERDDDADRPDGDDEDPAYADDVPRPTPEAPPTKGPLTRRGEELLAEARTTALRAALRDKPRDLVEAAVVLLLALTANNVRVDGEPGRKFSRSSFDTVAATAWFMLSVMREKRTTQAHMAALRRAHLARLLSEAAARILICGPTPAGNASGDAAEWVGQIVGAEDALPRLDTEDFLATISGDALRQVAPALLEDSKAAKLTVAGLRQRLAGQALGLARQGALAGLVAFCRAPPALEDTEHYFAGKHDCAQQAGAAKCVCGWRKSEGDAAAECSAARWEAELARLAPWPTTSTTAAAASTPEADASTREAERACRWDGQSKCPDDLTKACMDHCPRRAEYAAWWESPAGAAATATEQERAAARLAAEAPAEPPTAPKRGRKVREATDPPAPIEEVREEVTQACGWNGESLCSEEGTTRCEEHCQRNGRYRAFLATPAGKAARRVSANAEARANLRSRRGGRNQPA